MVHSPTRRKILQLGGAALGVSLAGCSSPQEESTTESRLVELSVLNHTESQHTVHAVLQDGDEVVYWSSIQVTPGDREKNEAGGGEFSDYPTEAGMYTLYAKADNQPDDAWVQAKIYEWGYPCWGLKIRLGEPFSDSPEKLAIWRHNNCKAKATDT